VHGDIHAADAILGGKVVGAVIASERVEIQATAAVQGDIHTKSIVVFEGGIINGTVRMGDMAAGRLPNAAPGPNVRLASDA
jgi:cytoskeletal protein CcmA (bactofilin family)